jgi:hypothetical protein
MSIETHGIGEIIINMQSNIPDKSSFELMSDVYYVPGDTDKYNKYPFFTNKVKYPTSIGNKSQKEIKAIFFNRTNFEREIIGKSLITPVTENEMEVNGRFNIQLFISLMMPISFPVINNYHTSFNEKIKQDTSNWVKTNSWKSYIFGQKDKFSYIKFGENIYTFIEVTWVNDIINNPQYYRLFRQLFKYEDWKTKEIKISEDIMAVSKTGFEEDYNKFIEALLAKPIVTGRGLEAQFDSNLNEIISINDASSNRAVKSVPTNDMNPILEKLGKLGKLDKLDQSYNDKLIMAMDILFDLRKLELDAQHYNKAGIFFPATLERLSNFRKIIIHVQKYYYRKELTNYLDDLNGFIKLIKKPADEFENQWEVYVQKQLKSINQVSQIIDVVKQFRIPLSDNDIQTVKNYQYATNNKLQDILNKFGEKGSAESILKIREFMSHKPTISNDNKLDEDMLDTGIIIRVQNKIAQDKKKDDIDDDIFGLNTKKIYTTELNVNFVKGEITPESMKTIKCEYQNNNLIRMFESLRDPQKDLRRVYNKELIDIESMGKKSNTKQSKVNTTQKQPAQKRKGAVRRTGQKGGYTVKKRKHKRGNMDDKSLSLDKSK